MRRLLAALVIAVTLATGAGCASIHPQVIRAKVTCYAPNPDAGACHGNIYVPS
jgi:hypothetical protein